MYNSALGPGDDIEAWCTRCRMNLNHRIIAMVGSDVRRVQCLTCGSDHKYYPQKGTGTGGSKSRVVRVSATGSRKGNSTKKTGRPGEWETFMTEMPTDTSPRPYRIFDAYGAAEFLEHPVFGIGRVVDVLAGDKIEVAFKEGRKVLLCNKESGK
jgi:hypothetical protein